MEPFRERLKEYDALIAAPDFFSDQRKAAKITREHTRISNLVKKFEAHEKFQLQIEENKALAEDDSVEDELKEMAQEEVAILEAQREKLSEEILLAMIPPDESDSRNIVMEIRGGAGGEEAALDPECLDRRHDPRSERVDGPALVEHAQARDLDDDVGRLGQVH